MSKLPVRSVVLLVVALLMPAVVSAQATITGVVADTSGAVLPGATVEASSPALIEKVRSAISDGTGQYRIVSLPPGTYDVTFTLPGFATVKREGVVLSGTFVATINGDLRVGALEETVTVTGETPIVDVQSARTQQTVSKDVLTAIPTSRLVSSLLNTIPGMVFDGTEVGGSTGMQTAASRGGAIHGSRIQDARIMTDGLSTAFNGGGFGMYMANVGTAQEVAISISGGLGESEAGGVQTNLVPRDGGNTYSGQFFVTGANGAMQGSNFTQELKDQGLTSANEILKVYDINPAGGGRFIRDKLWFYSTFRVIGAHNTVAGMNFNKNAGNDTVWTYERDLNRPQPLYDNKWYSTSLRLTWQATPRNKFATIHDQQLKCDGCIGGGTSTVSPEANGRAWNDPSMMTQGTWSSPVTNRVLLEAGYGQFLMWYRGSNERTDGTFIPAMVNVVEQGGIIPGLSYRQPATYSRNQTGTRTWRGSLSYVTGAHNMKFGYFGGFQNPHGATYAYLDISGYRFNNGVPNQFTMQGNHSGRYQITRNIIPTSFYAQDSWTTRNLTLQGGLRYDHMVTSYPEQRAGGTLFVPQEIVYEAGSIKGVSFNDITPRMGASYDVFGNGKTAVKVSLGNYPLAHTGGDLDQNPIARLNFQTTRSWTDTDKDYVPDCVLTNPAKNSECGAMANQEFGVNTFSTNRDPDVLSGWGVRRDQWEFSTSVQQEVLRGLSVNFGYFRRNYGKFLVVDNLAVGPQDFDPFSVTAPVDVRLPDGGGQLIDGLYNVKPAKFGLTNNYETAASNYGNQIDTWQGVDLTVNARLPVGVTMQGGLSSGRQLTDNCEIREKLPEIAPLNPYCRVEFPYLTNIRGFGSYTVPRVDVQISATFQSNIALAVGGIPQSLAANYNVPNAVVKTSLGRDLSGGAANATVNLVETGTLFSPRLYQLDMRFAKILRYGRTRTQIGVDIYNSLNSSYVSNYNQTYVPGGAWLTPQDLLPARFVKLSAQFDF